MTGPLTTRELGKFLDHALIDRALERHDQVRKIFHRLPTPIDEFGLVPAAEARDIDLGILAGKTNRVPFLPLATVTALPRPAGNGARNVIDQPVGDLAELLYRTDAGFLIEFALRRLPGILPGIDAALRHLPDMGF